MAILKMGAIVTQISGKVGGQTFGIGKSGQYLKNTGTYINARTIKRTGSNTLLALITSQWRTLTQTQRDAWESATSNFPYTNRLGDTEYYSGFNLFTKFNVNRALIDLAILTTPPSPTTVNLPTDFEMTPTTTTFPVFTDEGISDNLYLIYCAPPVSQGQSKNKKQLRLIYTATASELSTVLDIYDEYVEIFGAPLGGTKIFLELKVINKDTGIAANPNLLDNYIVIV